VAVARKKPASYQELLDVPAHLVGEIVDGELHTSPRPSLAHAMAASSIMVPDLAGWRRGRMPQVPDTAFAELAPDWVCEVISPTTGALDRAGKMPHYGRAGVGHVWLVDPAARTVEIFRFDGGWRLADAFAENAKVRAEPFDAVEPTARAPLKSAPAAPAFDPWGS
jgi:hypothetical protein